MKTHRKYTNVETNELLTKELITEHENIISKLDKLEKYRENINNNIRDIQEKLHLDKQLEKIFIIKETDNQILVNGLPSPEIYLQNDNYYLFEHPSINFEHPSINFENPSINFENPSNNFDQIKNYDKYTLVHTNNVVGETKYFVNNNNDGNKVFILDDFIDHFQNHMLNLFIPKENTIEIFSENKFDVEFMLPELANSVTLDLVSDASSIKIDVSQNTPGKIRHTIQIQSSKIDEETYTATLSYVSANDDDKSIYSVSYKEVKFSKST